MVRYRSTWCGGALRLLGVARPRSRPLGRGSFPPRPEWPVLNLRSNLQARPSLLQNQLATVKLRRHKSIKGSSLLRLPRYRIAIRLSAPTLVFLLCLYLRSLYDPPRFTYAPSVPSAGTLFQRASLAELLCHAGHSQAGPAFVLILAALAEKESPSFLRSYQRSVSVSVAECMSRLFSSLTPRANLSCSGIG